MLFWVIAALLTACASVAVLLPLTSASPSAPEGEADLEVYRDQLDEVERDQRRGLIDAEGAEQVRAEIGRRILKADGERRGSRGDGSRSRVVLTAAVLSVPLLSWSIYGALGSPDTPPQPLSARLVDPANGSIEELIARAEAHLAANPDDGKGWDVLAPIYVRIGRQGDAAAAYRNALRLLGPSAEREAGLGEALVDAQSGIVSQQAKEAFDRALKADPAQPKANFFSALASAQAGNAAEARSRWQAMRDATPQDSPWRAAANEALARLDTPGPATAAAGPDEDQVKAAASMNEGERTAMIESMVAGLDQKLRDNPKDLEGWKRLVRSYVVLQKPDAASDALMRGRAARGEGSADAATLASFAEGIGLGVVK